MEKQNHKADIAERQRPSWRKTIPPIPWFLIRTSSSRSSSVAPQERSLKTRHSFNSLPSQKDHLPLPSFESPVRLSLGKQSSDLGARRSFYPAQKPSERIILTMSKFSFWMLVCSLIVVGVLLFLCGFIVSFYITNKPPSLSSDGPAKAASIPLLERLEDEHLFHKTPEKDPSPPISSREEKPPVKEKEAPSEVKKVTLDEEAASGPLATSLSKKAHEPQKKATATSFKESPLINQIDPQTGASQKILVPYSMEFGIFTTRQDALTLVNQLVLKGYFPVIIRITDAFHILSFSVRCGQYKDRASAVHSLHIAQQQNEDLGVDVKVVRNDPFAAVVYP